MLWFTYPFSLLLCSVYHELGHAVCAVNENVRVLGVGIFVVFLIPAAYVDLPTDQLITKSNLQKLRIFSAGVWHNLILVAIRYFLVIGTNYSIFANWDYFKRNSDFFNPFVNIFLLKRLLTLSRLKLHVKFVSHGFFLRILTPLPTFLQMTHK